MFFALVLGLPSLGIPDKIQPEPVDGLIHWVYDYDRGKKLANEQGKPIFLVFRCER